MNWSERKELIKATFTEFFREKSLMHGAALSYYSMLALIPMLYLSITYVGMIVGNDVIMHIVKSMLQEIVGVKDSGDILGFLDEVDFKNGSAILQIAGILALLFSCSAIFNSIRNSLNVFYDIQYAEVARKKIIIRNLLGRLISMSFVLGVTVLIVVLYFAETLFLSLGTDLLEDMQLMSSLFAVVVNHGVPIFTNVIVFYFIFKFMHDGRVEKKNALSGAFLTGVLLYLGQVLIKYYLNNYFFAANGGVAGTMLVILVWVYYTSQIIFFGAKYIAVLSRMKGTPIKFRD